MHNSSHRAIKSILGVAIAMLCCSALVPGAAVANRSDCDAQWFCLWDGPSYGDRRLQFHDNGGVNLASYGFDDQASSVYNNTNRWGRLSLDWYGGGASICIGPGQYESFFATGWNNQISSLNLQPSPC